MMSVGEVAWMAQKPLETFAGFFGTDVKVKKVALLSFSSLSFFVSVKLATLSFSATFLAVPFLCLSFLFFKVTSKLKDYQNPFELQILRKEAKELSFSQVVREHQGIDTLLLHQLLSKEDLKGKFHKEIQGKSLSKLLEERPLSVLLEYELLNQREIRKIFYEELQKMSCITELYRDLGDMGLNELKRFKVISSSEYESLASFQIEEEELEVTQKKKFLSLDIAFLGRRESLLSYLERKEKKAKEEIRKSLSQNKEASSIEVLSLQRQIKATLQEKTRIEKESFIGLDLQRGYEKGRVELEKDYLEEKKRLEERFSKLKEIFAHSISIS